MNRRVYRICLIMIIAVVVVSGIFYYRFTQKKEIAPSEGVFVWQAPTGEAFLPYGNFKDASTGETFIPYGNHKKTAGSEWI